jgi:MYXO-CTERM domain-containing protein
MRTSKLYGVFGVATLVACVFAAERDAAACGACFAPPPPPGEPTSVVTDHRMVLSISPQQTTLYDQIRYTGSPSSFAWVLPIAGTAQVGLSADVMFGALDALSTTQVLEPPKNCPQPPSSCFQSSNDAFGAPSAAGVAADAGAARDAGVDVLSRQTVGPYETVQLRSTDPGALITWLTQNNFSIPDEMRPIIASYVADKFDFLALKLVPGQGVQAMRPVRVTTLGASAALPLRMVAGGTGQTVGITLWMVGEGRYEPSNFPFFQIENKDLAWDWTQGASTYKEIRARQTEALGGKGWEVESSIAFSRASVVNSVQFSRGPGPTGNPYEPVTDANGRVTQTADQVRQLDMDTLFKGIPQGSERLTRIRADLSRAALGDDLSLRAAADQAVLSNIRNPALERGSPQCPIYNGCQQIGVGTREEAQAALRSTGKESFSCSATPSDPAGWGVTLAALAGFAGIVISRRKKGQACEK